MSTTEASTDSALADALYEVGGVSLRDVEQFIYQEARLQDDHHYDAWEDLWTDDAIYWVPANGAAGEDPDTSMSIIYDNRSRIGTRIKQLHTGKRHAQNPRSELRRVISNIELLGEEDGDIHACGNFVIYESRERGMTTWAGRYDYRLRPSPDGLSMAFKKVSLVGNDRALYTLAFLI